MNHKTIPLITIGIIFALLLQAGVCAQDKSVAPDKQASVESAAIIKLISDLDHQNYRRRKAAHQDLLKAGSESIPLLEKAAIKASKEASSRILLIMEHHVKNENEKFYEPATDALENFLNSTNRSIRYSTNEFWNRNIYLIEYRAINKLESLGAYILWSQDKINPRSGIAPSSTIQSIRFTLNWSGGEEGLRYLGRLKSLSKLAAVYNIEGNGLVPKSFQKVEALLPDLHVGFRGPSLLGVSCETIDFCRVKDVQPGSTAGKAGIRPYDIITKFNGKETPNFHTLTDQIAETFPGDKVKLTFLRDQMEYEVEAVMQGWEEKNNKPVPANGKIIRNGLLNPTPKNKSVPKIKRAKRGEKRAIQGEPDSKKRFIKPKVIDK